MAPEISPGGSPTRRRAGEGLAGTQASVHLDFVRGAAAVAVLLFHVRYRFFLDYGDVVSPSVLGNGWYAFTSFGHDAVIVFFVLSGFLVGGATARAIRDGRWQPREYVAARLSRMYVVLLPALALSSVWDLIGMRLFSSHPIYTGVTQSFRHDFFPVAPRSELGVLAGNVLFLQPTYVPPFGSNDALWSLGYEAWYYVAGPFAALALWAGGTWNRILAICLAATSLALAGQQVAMYFSIWLLGMGVAMLPTLPALQRHVEVGIAVAVSIATTIAGLGHTSFFRQLIEGRILAGDLVVAVAFAFCLYVLLHDRRIPRENSYASCAKLLARISFTLYAVHLPVLVFVRAWLVPGEPWLPTPATIAAACAIALTTFGYALLVAACFESRTSRIRRWLGERLRDQRLNGQAAVQLAAPRD